MRSSKISKQTDHWIVIGSGIAGMASACRLAASGKQVAVYEQSSTYGGKIGEWRSQGFRFDKGPSLFTLPEVLDELFLSCKKNPREYYDYQQLPTVTKYYYSDGLELNAHSDLSAFQKELVDKLGENQNQLERFFKRIEEVYNFVYPIFLENPIAEFNRHLPGSYWDTFKMLLKIEGHKSLNSSNKEWFKHPKTVQLFNRFATYNGSNPYRAPATLNVIPHLEHKLGAFYVKGGMRKVAEAIYQLAIDLKVQFVFNSKVEKIMVTHGQARGIVTDGKEVFSDGVVCNMDINKAYPLLLKKERQPSMILNQEKSTSALVFYWGMDISDSHFDVHNVLFSSDYKYEFDCLAKGEISQDPTVYVYISSKAEASDAPKGKENWFVMINVPPNEGQDWARIKQEARKSILAKLNNLFEEDVSEQIVMEEVLDPIIIEESTSSDKGALYGNSSNSMFSAFLRHQHRNKRINDLYFVGGSVHPGGGIPLCLLSAKIATDVV